MIASIRQKSDASAAQGPWATWRERRDRSRLWQQAIDWLRAELDALGKRLEQGADKARPFIVRQMQHRLQDSDFAGVRGEEALTKLPELERNAWQKLWSDVEAMRAEADGNNRGPGKTAKDR